MDFWELLKIVFRRWIVVLPILAATGMAMYVTQGRIQPEYRVELTSILLSPAAGYPGFNPYLQLGTPGTAQTLQITGAAPDTQAKVAAKGNSTNYEIVIPRRSPMVTVIAIADTPARATATADQVTDLLAGQLQARQKAAHVSSAAWITIQRLTSNPVPVPVSTQGKRLMLMMIASGVGLALAAALVLNAVARVRGHILPKRLRRRPKRRVSAETVPPRHDAGYDPEPVAKGPPGDDLVPVGREVIHSRD